MRDLVACLCGLCVRTPAGSVALGSNRAGMIAGSGNLCEGRVLIFFWDCYLSVVSVRAGNVAPTVNPPDIGDAATVPEDNRYVGKDSLLKCLGDRGLPNAVPAPALDSSLCLSVLAIENPTVVVETRAYTFEGAGWRYGLPCVLSCGRVSPAFDCAGHLVILSVEDPAGVMNAGSHLAEGGGLKVLRHY